MTTPTREKAVRKTISATDAARELGVHLGTLVGWAQDGKLPMFVPPGKELGDGKRGPKGYKIFLVDWEAFKAANTKIGMGLVEAAPPRTPATGPVTGTDGVRRRKIRRPRTG